MNSSSAGARQSAVGSLPAVVTRPDGGRTRADITATKPRFPGPAGNELSELVQAASTIRIRSSVGCRSNEGPPRPKRQTTRPGKRKLFASSGPFALTQNPPPRPNVSGPSRLHGLVLGPKARRDTRAGTLWTRSCLTAVEFQKYCKGES